MGDTVLFYVGTPTPILHTYRILSEGINEGFIGNVAESEYFEWGGPGDIETLGTFTLTNNAEGDKNLSSATITHPAPPASAPSGKTLTGNYRTVMDATATISLSGGEDPTDWAQGKTQVAGLPWPPMIEGTTYTSTSGGVPKEGFVMDEYVNYLNEPLSESDHPALRYYYDNGDSSEGETFHWYSSTYAYKFGAGGMTSILTTTLHGLWQEAENVNDNVGDWSNVSTATVATGSSGALKARVDTASHTTWELSRGFLTFSPRSDLTSFANRTVTSIGLSLYDLTSGTPQNAIIQEGTQVGGGGEVSDELQDTDFNKFTGALLTPTISGWGGAGDYVTAEFNSTGEAFVTSKIEAQSDIKFCIRDYPTDYLTGAVGTPASNANCRFGNHGGGAYRGTWTPAITITYMKVPEWTEHTFDWTIDEGTYSNGKYYPVDSFGWELRLIPNGGWEVGYRPVGMRVTFTGAASIDQVSLYAKDQYNEYLYGDLVDESNVVSQQVLVVYFQANDPNDTDTDMEELYFKHNTDGWAVSKIEFLAP